MPHDILGRLIEVGDYVKTKPYNYSKVPVVGRVVEMRQGQTCSGDLVFITQFEGNKRDAFGADEAELILKADGSNPESVKENSDETV